MDDQKARLKQLILDAEMLMQTARSEAGQIVARAEARARELVEAARQLHAAAEAESSQLRSTAAETRRRAEEDARRLSDDAQARHLAAIEEARSVVSSPGRPALVQPAQAETRESAPSAEDLLREASEKADQMLRVARSEAKARSEELIEQARRRAAQIEEDARRREEVAAMQFREIQRRMRDEQLEIKTRIAELRAELRAAGSKAGAQADPDLGLNDAEIRVDVAPRPSRAASRAESPTPPGPAVDTVPAQTAEPFPTSPSVASRLGRADNREERERASDDATADEYTRAMRRFRKRA
ncbi:MAG TPA: hypothetical protein VIW46_14480 [Acidimicrobiia bacterium]